MIEKPGHGMSYQCHHRLTVRNCLTTHLSLSLKCSNIDLHRTGERKWTVPQYRESSSLTELGKTLARRWKPLTPGKITAWKKSQYRKLPYPPPWVEFVTGAKLLVDKVASEQLLREFCLELAKQISWMRAVHLIWIELWPWNISIFQETCLCESIDVVGDWRTYRLRRNFQQSCPDSVQINRFVGLKGR